MFKFVTLLLKLTHLLAQSEEKKQELRQKNFRRIRAAQAKALTARAERAHARASALTSKAATASAESIIGSNAINEAQRLAGTLRSSLDYIVPKK